VRQVESSCVWKFVTTTAFARPRLVDAGFQDVVGLKRRSRSVARSWFAKENASLSGSYGLREVVVEGPPWVPRPIDEFIKLVREFLET
jgi:hypothetical protein